jgi:2-dehydropantoate 2-reductase
MRIGIVGAGAMGSIFAYFFVKAKTDVVIFESNTNTVMNYKHGINIILEEKKQKIRIPIDNNPQILAECDIIIIFVKSYDTEEAIKKIAPIIGKQTVIVSLQNGLGNKETIARYISEDIIVYGSTSIGATKIDNNTVRLGGMGDIVIGGTSQDKVKTVKNVLNLASLEITIAENPDAIVWKKAIINAGINPLGALLEISNGQIINNEYSKKIQEQIVREAVITAVSLGLLFDPDDMVCQTISVCEKTSKNLCSMLQDVIAKRKTEIDSINGIIIEYAKKSSIDTPYNVTIYNLIKAKEMLFHTHISM